MKRSDKTKTREPKLPPEPSVKDLNRRAFVKLVPALGAAALATPSLNIATAQAPSPSPTPLPSPSPTPAPLRVTKDMLHQAEKLIGIELSDAQEAMALQNVSTNLDRYEALRKIDVPLDTEPATLFHPALPGKKFNAAPAKSKSSTKFKLSKSPVPAFSSLDELAFAPLTQLAELIRSRNVSPVEL